MKLEEQETPATPPSPPHYMYIPYQVAVNQSPDNEMKYYTSYTNNSALLFRTDHRVPVPIKKTITTKKNTTYITFKNMSGLKSLKSQCMVSSN